MEGQPRFSKSQRLVEQGWCEATGEWVTLRVCQQCGRVPFFEGHSDLVKMYGESGEPTVLTQEDEKPAPRPTKAGSEDA
jgi:hypothetical protein